MTLGDLETAARLKVPLTVIVVNNAASGYIKALQHAMFGGRYQSSDLSDLNYATVAESLGCRGIRVTDPDKLADAFGEALGERRAQGAGLIVDLLQRRFQATVESRAVRSEEVRFRLPSELRQRRAEY